MNGERLFSWWVGSDDAYDGSGDSYDQGYSYGDTLAHEKGRPAPSQTSWKIFNAGARATPFPQLPLPRPLSAAVLCADLSNWDMSSLYEAEGMLKGARSETRTRRTREQGVDPSRRAGRRTRVQL